MSIYIVGHSIKSLLLVIGVLAFHVSTAQLPNRFVNSSCTSILVNSFSYPTLLCSDSTNSSFIVGSFQCSWNFYALSYLEFQIDLFQFTLNAMTATSYNQQHQQATCQSSTSTISSSSYLNSNSNSNNLNIKKNIGDVPITFVSLEDKINDDYPLQFDSNFDDFDSTDTTSLYIDAIEEKLLVMKAGITWLARRIAQWHNHISQIIRRATDQFNDK